MLPALAFVLMSSANAGRNDDPCASIKPEQQLATEQKQVVDGALKIGIPGLGRGEAELSTDTETTYDTALLGQDDLARSWYVYQLCVMKRDGQLTASLYDDLMRQLFGLEQQPAPATAAPGVTVEAAAAAGACPWRAVDSASASKSGVVINGHLWPIATAQDQNALGDVLNLCGKGEAAALMVTWTQKQAASQEKNVLGQPSRSAQLAMVSKGRAKKKMLAALVD
jgi:hypothetical protein